MTLIFGNPWGFSGLLGIPLLVLIYYLRRRARVVTVTTLFLLGRTQRESKAGRRFETFSNSLPFWLQVLAVLLLTWLLVDPKYGNHRVTRQIAVVLDSSASMQPLRESLPEKLAEALTTVKGSADHASYFVLDHDPREPRIYAGDRLDDLKKNLAAWNPTDGARDPAASLRIARSLVGPGGVVLFVTDHEGGPLPGAASRLALGEARANCGFTGVTVERAEEGFAWTALVRNYGDAPQTREWSLETTDGRRTEPREMVLPPGRFLTLKGEFPEGARRCLLRLSGDLMPLDDVRPMVVEEPKVARLGMQANEEVTELGERMIRGFPHVVAAESPEVADFRLRSLASGERAGSDRPAIFFFEEGSGGVPTGRWLMEEHALTTGLNFQALSLRALETLPAQPDDQVLLWLDGQAVIVLRQDPVSRAECLVFAFSLGQSNAAKLPAMAVLWHRFAERVARETLSPHTAVFETGQQLAREFPTAVAREDLALTFEPVEGAKREIELREGFRVTERAPEVPGFLSLRHRGEPLLEAAVVFGDTREADLSRATTSSLPSLESELVERRTRQDRFWRVVVILLLGLVLGAWYFLNPRKNVK